MVLFKLPTVQALQLASPRGSKDNFTKTHPSPIWTLNRSTSVDASIASVSTNMSGLCPKIPIFIPGDRLHIRRLTDGFARAGQVMVHVASATIQVMNARKKTLKQNVNNLSRAIGSLYPLLIRFIRKKKKKKKFVKLYDKYLRFALLVHVHGPGKYSAILDNDEPS